jgi:hypothetical protein
MVRPSLAEVAAGRRERIAAQVIHLPLVRVGQDVVGVCNLLEPLLGDRIRVHVGM